MPLTLWRFNILASLNIKYANLPDYSPHALMNDPLELNPLYELTRAELAELVKSWGYAYQMAARIWRALYRQHVSDWDAVPDLPPRLRACLHEHSPWRSFDIDAVSQSDDDRTFKYLLRLPDGVQIETVRMHHRGRLTVCLSSQAGCALGCVFCATGQQGFTRNLTAGEIVAQAMHVARVAKTKVTNLVLMGMGEPLLNYDAVMKALDILCDGSGLAIGYKQVTISTVGIVPAIRRLAEERRPYSLAVSLHAATQTERAAMLPIARTWHLDELISACRDYAMRLDRKILFEWTLIAGVNDSPEQALVLAELLHGLPAHVNLIPLNPTEAYPGTATQEDRMTEFQNVLRSCNLPSTVRQRRGIEVGAGCGQLAGAGIH